MIPYTPPKSASALPLIDLAGSFSPDPDRRLAVAQEVHKACRHTGFFYIAGHGIPEEMLAAQLAWAGRFFALPLADKEALVMPLAKGFRGYEAFQRQTSISALRPI